MMRAAGMGVRTEEVNAHDRCDCRLPSIPLGHLNGQEQLLRWHNRPALGLSRYEDCRRILGARHRSRGMPISRQNSTDGSGVSAPRGMTHTWYAPSGSPFAARTCSDHRGARSRVADGARGAQRAEHAVADHGARRSRIGGEIGDRAVPAIALESSVDVLAPGERHKSPESPGAATELLPAVVPERDADGVRRTRHGARARALGGEQPDGELLRNLGVAELDVDRLSAGQSTSASAASTGNRRLQLLGRRVDDLPTSLLKRRRRAHREAIAGLRASDGIGMPCTVAVPAFV